MSVPNLMEIQSVTSKSGGYVFLKTMNVCAKLCANLLLRCRDISLRLHLDGSSGNQQSLSDSSTKHHYICSEFIAIHPIVVEKCQQQNDGLTD